MAAIQALPLKKGTFSVATWEKLTKVTRMLFSKTFDPKLSATAAFRKSFLFITEACRIKIITQGYTELFGPLMNH